MRPAPVAQRIEQPPPKRKVAGSIPAWGTWFLPIRLSPFTTSGSRVTPVICGRQFWVGEPHEAFHRIHRPGHHRARGRRLLRDRPGHPLAHRATPGTPSRPLAGSRGPSVDDLEPNPRACRRLIRLSPIACAVVTWPRSAGSRRTRGSARTRPASWRSRRSPGSPPDTRVWIARPSASPTKSTVNHDFSRSRSSGALALLDPVEQQVAQRLDLGGHGDGAAADGASGGVPQGLGAGVVRVAELRAVRRQRRAAAATTTGSIVGSGSSQKPSSLSRWGLPPTAFDERPSGRASIRRRRWTPPHLLRTRDRGHRRVERAAGEHPARRGPRHAVRPGPPP